MPYSLTRSKIILSQIILLNSNYVLVPVSLKKYFFEFLFLTRRCSKKLMFLGLLLEGLFQNAQKISLHAPLSKLLFRLTAIVILSGNVVRVVRPSLFNPLILWQRKIKYFFIFIFGAFSRKTYLSLESYCFKDI